MLGDLQCHKNFKKLHTLLDKVKYIEKETVEIFKILRNFDTSTISKSR